MRTAPPGSPQNAAAEIDRCLERDAQSAHRNALETGDDRWNKAALALLGARRFFRELMSDEDRKVKT